MWASTSATTRQRACEECRQQKIKCDAHLDYSKPCSKCKRSGVQCVFRTDFTKRKTRSKAKMQREIDGLRRALQLADEPDSTTAAYTNHYRPSSTTDTVAPQAGQRNTTFYSPPHAPTTLTTIPISVQGLNSTVTSDHAPVENLSSFPYTGQSSSASAPQAGKHVTTFCPSLDGLQVEPRKLEDCYSLYFEHYHSIIPILDPQQSCRDCFQHSPLMFWTIIVTGSRRYGLDPTLLEMLAPKVSTLAALATNRASEYIATISALLLLCVWPLPMENASDDPSTVYTGVIMQLAQQNGLYMLSRRQDFSQNRLIEDTESDIFLATLWAWCKLVCCFVNVYCGLHHHLFEDAFDLDPESNEVLGSLSRPVFWMLRFVSLISTAHHILMKGKYGEENVEASYQLQSMIKFYDNETLKIKQQAQGHLAEIYFISAKLHVGAYHFFVSKHSPSKLPHLFELYHVACMFIDNITTRDQKDNYALYLSEQYYRTLTLAAMTILRIYRSTELASSIDYIFGEQSYFAAIRIYKKRALKNNDLNAQMAAILSQLWRSQRVFMQQDGSVNSLNVRIRTRGAMGVAYDCLWYWRQEFLGQPDPYANESHSFQAQDREALVADSQTATSNIQTTTQLQDYDSGAFVAMGVDDRGLFSEWNWSTDPFLYGQQSEQFGEAFVGA